MALKTHLPTGNGKESHLVLDGHNVQSDVRQERVGNHARLSICGIICLSSSLSHVQQTMISVGEE